jgi:recombinational DNA repair protein (RecF pathway)
MPHAAVELCCECGKTIDVKNVRSYRVREDYRLVCIECFKRKLETPAPESQKRRNSEKKR